MYTVTNMILAPDASWCAESGENRRCPKTPLPSLSSQTATTRFWAPLIITNPESCTKTSFSYTSSQQQFPNFLVPSSMAAQATESAEALLITTLVVTVSTDLGGQAVTTTVVDIYLKTDAVGGVEPLVETTFLNQCVDPSSYMCQISIPPLLTGCGPTPITYPPRAGGVTAGSGSSSSGASAGASAPPTTSAPLQTAPSSQTTSGPQTTSSKSSARGLGSAVHCGLLGGAVGLAVLLLIAH